MTDAALTPARTRVAPSPTGDPHVGTAYMALFDLAWARKTGGRFVLRIEDTDQARYVEGSEQQIFDTLTWLGLTYDEGPDVGGPYAPYRQSERLDTYRPYVEQLVADGHAYYCWCSTERLAEMRELQQKAKLPTGYDRLCHGKTREERAALPGFTDRPVVRMLIPEDVETRFEDVIRGWVNAPTPDDQVILKADGFPTYHLAVVVDDHLMGITTVVRGEEWISSTPKHVLLHRWLGWEVPQFAHMPLLRNPDKSKISKRKNPAARLTWFREEGYLPEALLNFLQLVGYPPVADGQEVSSFDEFVERFEWTKVNTVGPIFDMDKLNWLNGHYIRALSPQDLAGRIVAHLVRTGELPGEPTPAQMDLVTQATPLVQERMQLLKEAGPMLGFLFVTDEELTFDPDSVAALKDDAPQVLDASIAALEGLEDFTAEPIQAALRAAIVDGLGIKPKFAFAPARVAVTGRRVSPPLFESMEILGRESTLTRLRRLRATL
ncbi:glutamate--tRNA ligase [Arsenicicoccus bolidensis]|uniref:Glutamate--tRNA ligase n=1 Tax=Arsenicicoccus bolidensis TaxID=229480 RepID=A0ABS9Q479_9MICO|nr:glutamate--tRNA ligase [Arsenicicoccus bolidensis]MCG7322681.1 glutamate--tRNA ligase [Arsenicicoccus bolidensis]